MNRPPPAVTVRLDDEKSEVVRRNHDQRISFIERSPAASLLVIQDVELADGVETTVAHSLGRKPKIIIYGAPRGPVAAGWIEEVRLGNVDRTKCIVLKANSYGATITVDIEVL